jgi:serine/threonine protein kinase
MCLLLILCVCFLFKLPAEKLRNTEDPSVIRDQAQKLQEWAQLTLQTCPCTLDHPDFVDFIKAPKVLEGVSPKEVPTLRQLYKIVKAQVLEDTSPEEMPALMQCPSPLEYGLIALLAYKLVEDGIASAAHGIDHKELGRRVPWLIKEFRNFFSSGWELFDMSTSHRDTVGFVESAMGEGGYHGIAMVHRIRKQMVIAHRGTVSRKDIMADIFGIMLNGITDHQKKAEMFCEEMLDKAKGEEIAVSSNLGDFELSFTGHSLGGWLAQCSCAIFKDKGWHAPAVAFDPPGTAAMLQKLVGTGKHILTTALDIKDLPIEVYLGAPNLVNTCASSTNKMLFTGVVWRIYPMQQAARSGMFGGLKDKLLYSIDQHSLVSMVQALLPTESASMEASRTQDTLIWRRRVVRWPAICWPNIQGNAAKLGSAITSPSVVSFFFSVSGLDTELKAYNKFFEFGTRVNGWEPSTSVGGWFKGDFDLQFKAEYETADWDENHNIMCCLCHPQVRGRLENFYRSNAHQKEIEQDAELIDWLGEGQLVRIPKLGDLLVLRTRKDFTLEKTQSLPCWFTCVLQDDMDRQLPPEEQRVQWFDKLFPPSMIYGKTAQQVSDEQMDQADKILALLKSTSNQNLTKGKQHIKFGNFPEAQKCFEQVLTGETELILPEDLANAKLLHVYSCCKLGIQHLQKGQFEDAAALFQRVLQERASTKTTGDWRKNVGLLHACSLYEAGKQHRSNGDWGVAKKMFESAKKTNSLPPILEDKSLNYLEESKRQIKESKGKARPDGDTEKLVVGEHLGISLYRQAKRALLLTNFNQAKDFFQQATEDEGLSDNLVERALGYIEKLDALMTADTSGSQCVFSDNCTHLLGSTRVTLGLSNGMLGLSTTTLLTSNHCNRGMVMVLNQKFPVESDLRRKLVIQLKTDIKNALQTIAKSADIEIGDVSQGSIVVHFRFVGNDQKTGSQLLEDEYLQQVDNKSSMLYQGEMTRHIDQKRTQTVTMQLGSSVGAHTPCMYQVGDTITLAQVEEEKIECKVESLLGEGATARVFRVTTNGKMCALKVFKAESSFLDLSEEASLILVANHPQSHSNVVRADFVWYEQRTNEMFFLMGLVDGGDLQMWMDDERLYAGTIEEQQQRLVAVAHQLACAVQHLHKRGILHQDVKPDNVLMTKAGKPILGDFGVASEGIMSKNMVEAMLRGATPVYASPHVRQLFFRAKVLPINQCSALLASNKITHLDDLWSMAATVFDAFAECGWRRGRSVAEVLPTENSLVSMAGDPKLMRVALPSGVLQVLQHCLGYGPETDTVTINSAVGMMLTAFAYSPPLTQDGLGGKRCANIRNNLAIALYDGGHHDRALVQLECATAADCGDARALNNLGVVQLARGDEVKATQCFNDALKVEPDHQFATFNVSLSERGGKAGNLAQFDRTGAAGAVEDSSSEVSLVGAVSFLPEQLLEVYRQSKWQRVGAGDGSWRGSTPLILLNYRLPSFTLKSDSKHLPGVWYATNQQQLFVHYNGDWCIGTVQRNFKPEFDQEMKQARDALRKLGEAERAAQKLSAEAKQIEQKLAVKNAAGDEEKFSEAEKNKMIASAETKRVEANRHSYEARQHCQEEQQYRAKAQQLTSRHSILLGEKHMSGHEEVVLDLEDTNHAPALFTGRNAIAQAIKSYEIELTDKHAFIFDTFSAQKLSTRTQTATLQYHAMDRVTETLERDEDVDSLTYQARAPQSQIQPFSQPERFNATKILEESCADLVLILGPAASGKTTLLKTLIMLILHRYGEFDLIPVLIPIIELIPILVKCDRDQGVSVIATFLQEKYPQHGHLLMQMMRMRRVVFLIDGMDEGGSSREAVQEVVTVELLEPGEYL